MRPSRGFHPGGRGGPYMDFSGMRKVICSNHAEGNGYIRFGHLSTGPIQKKKQPLFSKEPEKEERKKMGL